MATSAIGTDPTALIALIMAFFLFFMILVLGIYIYSALALVSIARKTNTEGEWMAWVPVANLVLSAKIARMPWQPLLLYIPVIILYILSSVFSLLKKMLLAISFQMVGMLLSLVVAGYMIVWNWKMYERVSRPGYWAVLPTLLVLFFMFIIILGKVLETEGVSYVGIIGFVASVLSQFVFLGIAAWHKDSTPSKN